MNLGDFALAVMLLVSLVIVVVGAVAFGVLGLAVGVRHVLRTYW